MTIAAAWLVAGALFIAIEIFGVPGIGFLFAGIGAIAVGGAVEFGVLDPVDLLAQFITFFVFGVASALALWKRLKRNPKNSYSNIVGTDATVGTGGLSGNKEGQVQWSGTLMRAKLADDAGVDVLPEGMVVTVRKAEGNILFVAPKP
jgi:membrane protein implicated in regulation of membrane protease activity